MRLHQMMIATALGLALMPGLAAADDNRGVKFRTMERIDGCPPGLAKKNNGCRTPGLAKKEHTHRYRVGDHIRGDYVIIEYPRRYGLDPRYTYWRTDGYVFRVNRETGEILDLIGAVAAILD
ncbi:hypothetical protein [Pseudothioclava nitratireducens]|uniref:hypothetical protein n=1 Tax=Pseudothioclava nitratireducens TaxID=1928646 RepID=UPI0023DB276B|nr:hypothetical protein [Defluviimonas nitratireducens]MDF1620034.1 hypothetical protein [Defluviimonas nitratireducens]